MCGTYTVVLEFPCRQVGLNFDKHWLNVLHPASESGSCHVYRIATTDNAKAVCYPSS